MTTSNKSDYILLFLFVVLPLWGGLTWVVLDAANKKYSNDLGGYENNLYAEEHKDDIQWQTNVWAANKTETGCKLVYKNNLKPYEISDTECRALEKTLVSEGGLETDRAARHLVSKLNKPSASNEWRWLANSDSKRMENIK